MVGTNYCPLNGIENQEAHIEKKLRELGIEVTGSSRDDRTKYCMNCCPAATC